MNYIPFNNPNNKPPNNILKNSKSNNSKSNNSDNKISDVTVKNSNLKGRDPKTGRLLPGCPGGPGRPKKEFSITHQLREIGNKKDRIKKLAQFMWDNALNAKISKATRLKFAIEVWDRLEGKPRQTFDVGPAHDLDTIVTINEPEENVDCV